MKKLGLLFILTCCLFLNNQHVNAASIRAPKYDFAVENTKEQTLYFHILSQELHTVSVTKGPSSYGDNEYVIPEKVEYKDIVYEVIAIADKAFYERDNIESILLPNTIRSIGSFAFEDCTFQTFFFPDSLKEVKEGAFNNTFIEHCGLDKDLPEIVGKYYTKKYVKGGYRIHEASRNTVSFINDVTKVITKLTPTTLGNLEESLFKNDLASYYQPILTKVERTNNPEYRYSGLKEVESDQVSWFKFEDEYIDMSISGITTKFDFILKNKTINTLKLIWDDAVFVNVDGNTSRIIHKGVNMANRESSQVSSNIIRNASLTDFIVPSVFLDSNGRITRDGFPEDSSYEGKKITLMLPIQIKEVINEYVLEFTLLYLPLHPERLK